MQVQEWNHFLNFLLKTFLELCGIYMHSEYIRILQDLKKIAGKKDILKVGLLLAPEIYLMINVAFFKKN